MSAATLTVLLSEETEAESLYLHYRSVPDGSWIGEDRLSFAGRVVQVRLTGLEAGTIYEVEVSRDNTFPPSGSLAETFATLPPGPYISNIGIENITPSSADVFITVSHPGTGPNNVHVRYRIDDSQRWGGPLVGETSETGTGRVALLDLSPGSSYEVEASLGDKFIAGETEPASFRTLLPRVAEVNLHSRTSSRATIDITISESGEEARTVYIRFRLSSGPQNSWRNEPAVSVTGESARFELTNLAPGGCYEVQASLDSEFVHGVVALTFSTVPLPSLGAVNVVKVSERTARMAVTILDPDGTEVTVYMRYRNAIAGTWSAVRNADFLGKVVEFELSGLEPGTEYQVEASLDPLFDTSLARVLVTDEEVTRVALLAPEDVTRSSVELNVEIANATGRSTVYVRYRSLHALGWEPVRTISTSSELASLVLRDLESDTLYEAEASLDSGFLPQETLYATFITEPGARIIAIRVENETDTKADVVVVMERVEGSTPVHLRYRDHEVGIWSSPLTRNTANSTAIFSLTELLPDTEYEIESSLDLSFPTSKSMYENLETDPAPTVSSIKISNVTDSEAKVSMSISRPQPRMTVYLRYRAHTSDAWSQVVSRTASSRSANVVLEGLTPETTYEVQASLIANFEEPGTAFFTTEEKAPSVSKIAVEDISETGARVNLSLSDSSGSVAVYLRYRKTGSSRWTNPASRTASSSDVSFELNNLSENTSYALEASLERTFPVQGRVQTTFITKSMLRVSGVVLEGVTETDARISLKLSGHYETNETMHIRYREAPDGEWQVGQILVGDAESTVLISNLMPDTHYELEASLDGAFREAQTESEQFRTIAAVQVIVPTSRPVAMTADALPREFSFAMPADASASDGSRLEIWSSEPAAGMEVSIKENLQWLIVEPEAAMAVNTGEILIVELTVDASGLGAGIYTGELEIIGNAENLPLRIPVTLTISAPTPESTPVATAEPIQQTLGATIAAPLSSPTPSPGPEPTITPTPSPESTIAPTPSPEPTITPTPTATLVTVSTVTPISRADPEVTPPPLPTSTPVALQAQERNEGLPTFTIVMVILAAVFLLVAGLSALVRMLRR